MSTPVAPTLDPSRRARILVDAGVTVVALVVWLVLWRYAILANDDLLAAERGGGGPFGQAGLAEIWRSYMIDYTERNGRAGDAITKAVLAIGPDAWRVIAPALYVLLSWTTWCTVRRIAVLGGAENAVRSPAVSLLAYGTISAVPFALIQTSPVNGGSMVFFLVAVVGYVFSLSLVFTGILLVARGLTIEGMRARVVWLATPCLLLAALTNEMSAVVAIAALGMTGVLFPSSLRRLPFWGAAAGAIGGLLVFLVSPGRTIRTQAVLDADDSSLTARVMHGVAAFWQSGGVLLLIALAVLWMLVIQVSRQQVARRGLRTLTIVSGGIALLIGAAALLTSHAYRVLSSSPGSAAALAYSGWWRHSGMLMLLSTLLCALLLAVAFVPLLRAAGVRPLIVLATMAAVAAVLPVALGQSDGRPYFHALYLLSALAVAVMVVIHSEHQNSLSIPRTISVALVGGLVILAAEGGVASWTALHENFAVWQQGGIQLDDAAHGERTSVVLPKVYPHPLWAYALSSPSEAAVELFRDWYGLDESVQITWQR